MNTALQAFKKVILGQAKYNDFDIKIEDCIEASKKSGIKEISLKMLNAKFRELAFNEVYNNYKTASAAK
jgi:hypothetical protein